MKKGKKVRWFAAGILVLIIILVGGLIIQSEQAAKKEKDLPKVLDLESKKSFEFFWKEANTQKGSKGFGLIRDRAPGNPGLSSIASVGFGLTAIPIGVERGWITKEEGIERVNGTLDTLLKNADNVNGVYYHFLNMDDATRAGTSEVSIIDTAILINGALTAGDYFQGDIKEKADKLYKNVNWKWFENPDNDQFYMAFSPENGFAGSWDFYGEQLMLYFLAAGSPTHPVNPEMFYDFKRISSSYKDGKPFIHSWFGSIFTYQFSHAWFDLRNKVDKDGVNWWDNSVTATKANRQFVMDHEDEYKTFGKNSWGVTASDGPNGYNGQYGADPSGYDDTANVIDGTIAPAGAAGSIVFTPKESIAALENYYKNYPDLWGKYGFKDAYNLDVSPAWYDEDVIGIDKGITLLMIENYRSGFVWKQMMKNQYVQDGMKKVGLVDANHKG